MMKTKNAIAAGMSQIMLQSCPCGVTKLSTIGPDINEPDNIPIP